MQEARENVTVGFAFTSDWLGMYCETLKQNTKPKAIVKLVKNRALRNNTTE